MARTAASAAWIVVMQGTPWATAAGADAAFVGAGALAAGRVDDQLNRAVGQVVEQVGLPFLHLVDVLHVDAGLFQPRAVPSVAISLIAHRRPAAGPGRPCAPWPAARR